MASGHIQIQITTVWVLGPAIIWRAAGDMAVLTVLGLTVYKRVSDMRWLCGYAWRRQSHAA